jgi:hypothetical protein
VEILEARICLAGLGDHLGTGWKNNRPLPADFKDTTTRRLNNHGFNTAHGRVKTKVKHTNTPKQGSSPFILTPISIRHMKTTPSLYDLVFVTITLHINKK